MLARNSAPGIGAQASPYLGGGQWVVGVSYRYQYSHRHFIGDVEQTQISQQGREIQNTMHLFDLSLTYAFHERFNVTLGMPYLIAERSVPIQDLAKNVIGRHRTSAHGIGDMSLTARLWVLNPKKFLKGNFTVGLGIKVPTGDPGKLDDLESLARQSIGPVDQSIQPGDGGFAILAEATGFVRLWHFTPYATVLYLSNPRDTNGVVTNRSTPHEGILSVGDSFLATLGTYFSVPKLKAPHGLAFKLGLRVEGVPTYDLLGDSNGFRRPGIALSLDPGVSYSYGRWSINLSVPIALYRNRFVSVPDLQNGNGAHGDAAFADFLVLAGISRVFGD